MKENATYRTTIFYDTSTINFTDLKLDQVPTGAGVYIFKDHSEKVLYVGKAKNLKKRIAYYLKKPLPTKTELLINKTSFVQFLVTKTEDDALVLEAQLIKKSRPPYNAVLRDDKNYPALKIDLCNPYPRIEIVRRVKNDNAQYFGPYTSASSLKEAVRLLRKAFPLRSCKSKTPPNRSRPCINHDMGLCLAPCCNIVDRSVYKKTAENLVKFLSGSVTELKNKLQKEMHEAAENLEFEKAAVIRDQIKAIDSIISHQHIVTSKTLNQDFIGVYKENGLLYVAIIFVRCGAVTGQKVFNLSEVEGEIPEVLSSFLRQYYGNTGFLPQEIIINTEIADKLIMERWLQSLKGKKVKLTLNPKGFKKELTLMANKNAQEYAVHLLRNERSSERSMEKLKELLDLDQFPDHMGCIDISTLQGRFSIGVLVVFTGGKPNPGLYRALPIDDLTISPSDTAMMAYTIEQLVQKEPQLLNSLDLLIIDGGKAQLNVASKKLSHFSIALAAIAKEKTGSPKSKRLLNEKIYIPGRKDPLKLNKQPEVLRLVQQLRDEAHRFAINNYRTLHRRNLKSSILDSIPGVGPKRKKALLTYFKDIYALKSADLEEIMAVPGIPSVIAKRIYDFFNSFGR